MTALRLARAVTGRTSMLKFAGGYHGHADPFLAAAGSGLATLGIPASPGVPEAVVSGTIVVGYGELGTVGEAVERHARPTSRRSSSSRSPGTSAVSPRSPGFLEGPARAATPGRCSSSTR